MQNLKITSIIIAIITGLITSQLSARSIYKCSRKGEITFTNVKAEAKGCKRIKIVIPPSRPAFSKTRSEINFPKVSKKTQQKRDQSRDQLIRQELENEKKQYALVKQKLENFEITGGNQQQSQIDQFKLLSEERTMRAKNIEELQKQLDQ